LFVHKAKAQIATHPADPLFAQVLLLRDNKISALSPLRGAPLLRRVDLSFNALHSEEQLRCLGPLAESLLLLQVRRLAMWQYTSSNH